MPAAADAWLRFVAQTHPLVEYGLGFTYVVGTALELLLAHLDIAALALGDRFACHRLVLRLLGQLQCALHAAGLLRRQRWPELRTAGLAGLLLHFLESSSRHEALPRRSP
ncbi:hypothetical protein D3C79_970900 [compost metagenome]